MNMKKTVAFILCLLILVTAMPMGVFAFPTNTEESFATEKIYGYFYKYDFDELSENAEVNSIKWAAGADGNPYGYNVDGSFPMVIKNHTDSQDKYAKVTFATGARYYSTFAHGKDGKSFVMGNTVSTEFDIRWQGVIEGSTLAANPSFELLSFKRNNNSGSTIVFFTATIVAEDTATDKYLSIRTPDGTEIAKLTKGADDFTNIKTVYYDATQTYSVYVNNSLVVEAKAGTRDTITDYTNFTYDDDGFVTPTTVSDGYGFFFCYIDNRTQNIAPCVIDVDNFCIKEEQVSDGRTAYYENSFEGTVGDLVDNSAASVAYNYSDKSKLSVGTEGSGKSKNAYLNVASQGQFMIYDRYQILQNGDWTVEFDARVTSKNNNFSLLGIYDGTNTKPTMLLNVTAAGQIRFAGGNIMRNIVSNTTMATEEGKWTHIVLSVNVDKNGANKGLFGDWSSKDANSLTYSISLWVDGVYAGSANQLARTEFLAITGTKVNDINSTQYIKATVTTAPTLPADNADNIKWIVNTGTLKQYIDESTGIRYYLTYDASGKFTTGVTLTPSTTKNVDYLSFFDSSDYFSDGAIDNIKIYEGVYPAANAVGKNDSKGSVAEIDFGYVIRPTQSTGEGTVQATQSSTGGDAGVIYFDKWHDGIITQKTANGDRYYNLATADNYLDVYTPNVGGKVFSSSVRLKGFSFTEGTSPVSLLSVKRQAAGGAQKVLDILMVDTSGNIYFTKDSVSYYLCDRRGNIYSASGSDWITFETIIDETGDTPLISYRVNGEAAYYKHGNFPYPTIATNIGDIVTDEITALKNAIDQRVCVLQVTGSTISVDLDAFKTELIENPFPEYQWEDEAIVDFSDYESIDDLSPQFYRTSGVKIENGVLIIPEGETFAWIDMNGSFAKKYASSTAPTGFSFEAKVKTSTANEFLIRAVYDGGVFNFANLEGNYVKGGGGKTNAKINTLEDGKFTDFVTLFGTNTARPIYYVDGNLVSSILGNFSVNTKDKDLVAFAFPDKTEISELYIHSGLESKLAENSGNIISIDPNIFTSAYSLNNGISVGILNDANKATLEEDNSKYYHLNSTPGAAFIPLYDHLEDNITVFESDIRFTPSEDASEASAQIALFDLLRKDSVGSESDLTEELLAVTPLGRLTTPYGILYNKDGSELVLSETEWQNTAVIYDANAGQISYRIGGDVPYYKDGDELILADKIQLKNVRYYKMDADNTRLRAVYFRNASVGTLDLKYLKVYNIGDSANIEFIGSQVSVSERDIRFVAGLDMLYYGTVGFNIEAFDADGNTVALGEKNVSTNTVYSSIYEIIQEEGETESQKVSLYPEEFGYRYFTTATVTGITQEKPVVLNVTPYTTVNGVKQYSSTATINIDFTEENMDNWIYTTDYKKVKPEGDNINANFSTTEYVAYTKDGALELNGLNAQFAFAANCEGTVSLDLANAFGEVATASVFDIYVDGKLEKENLSVPFGHHTLILAENLTKGDHSFKLVKKSGGDFVRINTMNFCGEIGEAPLLVKENAVDVVVSAPASGNDYGNVTVYLQTTEASGDYYIAYYFNYETTAPNPDWTFDSQPTEDGVSVNPGFNKALYRIAGAKLVEKLDTPYTYNEKFLLLDPREITLAIQEVGAADYVGGWHGDEIMTSVDFYLDGAEIDPTVSEKYTGTQFEMRQSSVLNRCNTLDVDIMNHNVKCLLNSNGIKLEQQVEFLTGDFKPNPTFSFLQMATFMRVNTSLSSSIRDNAENLLCRQTNLLNANGEINLTYDCVNDPDAYWVGTEFSDTNRYAEYIGNNEGDYQGIYGLIGFVIDDASVKAECCRLQRRSLDNKWYPSFDTYNGDTVPKGEVWNVSNSYFIDYNPELYTGNR